MLDIQSTTVLIPPLRQNLLSARSNRTSSTTQHLSLSTEEPTVFPRHSSSLSNSSSERSLVSQGLPTS